MKSFLTAVALTIASIAFYKYYDTDGSKSPPLEIRDPAFAQMRASANIEGREIEMAVFVRAASMAECEANTRKEWSAALDSCPTCTLQVPKCQEQLSPRYARLFDDVPIPSAYLSASAGSAAERDGRIVIYGLTDAEGVALCDFMRENLKKKYRGEVRCIAPSGA